MNTDLYLLRHGEPEIQNVLLGKTDAKLTSSGWEQLCGATDSLKKITKVVCSPLVRCSEFGKHWVVETGLPMDINHGFQECDFGDWDGQTFEQIKENNSSELSQFLIEPASFTPNGGESLADFQKRVRAAVDDLLNNNQGEKILLITHAGVIRCLISWCLKIDSLASEPFQNIAIDYGSMTHISVYHGEHFFPQLKSMNVIRNTGK